MENEIIQALQQALFEEFNIKTTIDKSALQRTKKEFTGDFTFVVFPYTKEAHTDPITLAQTLGNKLKNLLPNLIEDFNVVKGFLNLVISRNYWIQFIKNQSNRQISFPKEEESPIVIEFSSPNTNKPLHLGHIRNNLLGASVAHILEAAGKPVIRVNLVNDRGIHICKSMLAWRKYGNGETPESSGIKGDHLVGKYYVAFDQHFKAEIAQLTAKGYSEKEAEAQSSLMNEAREMLRKWEDNDPEIRALWSKMNQWVYDGFAETYQRLGIHFDKTYYESNTYLLGKEIVSEGLQKQVFYRKADNSVWVDLREEGFDEKLLLRSDGTSVYITQDLGTAQLRAKEFHPQKMIYVVGNEQNYHFDILKLILEKKLSEPFGKNIYHLSYGMVELPNGKMKSREGTVVDADDLMEEMYLQAQKSTEALGKFSFSEDEKKNLYEMVGIGALKYFILKVDPQKNMLFNPDESIDFNGNTAPFIQYTHARIKSLLRKAEESKISVNFTNMDANLTGENEFEIIKLLYKYRITIQNAAEQYSPALLANYLFELAKAFNHFYQETPIFKETNCDLRAFRLSISQCCAQIIDSGMELLCINVPEKM